MDKCKCVYLYMSKHIIAYKQIHTFAFIHHLAHDCSYTSCTWLLIYKSTPLHFSIILEFFSFYWKIIDIHHKFKTYSMMFNLHILWNDYHKRFSQHPSSHIDTIKRNLLVMRILSWNFMSKHMIRRRQWHPTPVLLPGKSHGWRSLVGCSPWGR